MPHLHVVAIRLPSRSATFASWAFVGLQRLAEGRWPVTTIRYPPWSATYRTAPPRLSRHDNQSHVVMQQLDLDNTRGPARPTLQTFHQIRAQLPIPPGCGERAARKSALGRRPHGAFHRRGRPGRPTVEPSLRVTRR